MIKLLADPAEKSAICREILEALPDWFGIPEAIDEYAELCAENPVWAAYEDGEAVGFVAMKPTSKFAAELAVMGVRQPYHRRGIGRELFMAMRGYAEEQGFEFIHVKTVEEGRYADYDRTNAFYRALGFKPLEVLPTLWDEQNPCQIYVMAVGKRADRL